MSLRIALGACASAAALAAAGCGGGAGAPASRSSSSPTTARSSSPPLTAASSGREVFAQACLVCHSVSGHSRPSQQGGDLSHFHSTTAELRQLTIEMPIVHHRLTSAEVTAVVKYVQAIEATGR